MKSIEENYKIAKDYCVDIIKSYRKFPKGKQIEIVAKTLVVALLAGLITCPLGALAAISGFILSGSISFTYFVKNPEFLNFYEPPKPGSSYYPPPYEQRVMPPLYRKPDPVYTNDFSDDVKKVSKDIKYYSNYAVDKATDFVADAFRGRSPSREEIYQRQLRDKTNELVHATGCTLS